jgi:MFS transporter, SET family, sugar efflux transporter
MNKLLVPSSALLWGLQLAFLSPALALILVNLYGATTAEVGWVLGIYNASGFVASLLLPAYADKKHDYLGPMLVCGALTLLLAVAVLNLATTAIMISHRRRAGRAVAAGSTPPASSATTPDESPVGRLGVVLIMAAFILLQATNATAMTIMTVYVTETLRLDVMWAGIALGVAAALEVPALLLISRLSDRFSHLGLIASGCVAGIAYYLGLTFATGPVLLIALQVLNAWFFAGIAGIGLPLFQQMIPRPGLSTGLYMNTRRIGSIVSGPIIAIGSLTVLGQRGIFLASAVLTLLGLAILTIANRTATKPARSHQPPASPSTESVHP